MHSKAQFLKQLLYTQNQKKKKKKKIFFATKKTIVYKVALSSP
jgi:hypothetical protein